MDARRNKLSSCKIPDQYLKNKKVIKTFRTLASLAEKKRIANTMQLLSQTIIEEV